MTISDTKITTSPFMPFDPLKYAAQCGPEGGWRPLDDGSFPVYPFEFINWVDEELSWYDNCYIHAGLNPFLFYDVHGKGLLDLFSDISVNTFNKFPVGKCRHTILCNNDGKVMVDGILVRRSEEDFITMCLPDPAMLAQMTGKDYGFESKDTCAKRFFFQLCGPRSLEVVEQATKTDLHDLEFMYLVDAQIAGKDVFILRTSMAGTLGYEVHGDIRNAFFHNPYEFGWGSMIHLDHDFVGREACEKAAADPGTRKVVTFEWNADDVADVFASQFRGEEVEPYKPIESPSDVEFWMSPFVHHDYVVDADGNKIGTSFGRQNACYFRHMISIGCIDPAFAEEGTEVYVLWGNPGQRQKKIRAKIARYPYNNVMRSDATDMSKR